MAQSLLSAAGRVLEREVRTLKGIIEDPKRPLVAVLGGAKVTDEIGVLDAFLDQADIVLVGGAMWIPFFKAQASRSAARCAGGRASIPRARRSRKGGDRLRLRSDLVPGGEVSADTEVRSLAGVDVAGGCLGLDIGHSSAEDYVAVIAGAGTVFWNGPMGAFELDHFADGTRRVAEAVAERPGTTVVAAATRRRRWRGSASPMTSTTSPPAVAPRSNY